MFLSSCSCFTKSVDNNNGITLTASNLTLLNGKYERKSTIISNNSLNSLNVKDLHWNFFANSYSYIFSNNSRGLNVKDSTQFIEIKVINKNKILVSHINMGDTLISKTMKGKIKRGYFEIKRKYLFIPTVVVNLYSDSKFRITLSNDNNLLTDFKQISFGTTYFIFPFYERIKGKNVIFKRIEDETE